MTRVGQGTLDQGIHDPMVELLRSTGTSLEWVTHHKPYDELPDLNVGMASVESKLQMKRALLMNGSSEVLAGLEALGIAHELVPHIREYFAARIARIDRRIASLHAAESK